MKGPSGVGIRLLEEPKSRQGDPRAASYVIDHVAPGTSFSRRFEVTDDTGHPVHLELYPNAAEIKGGTFLPSPRTARNEITEWVTVAPGAVDLQQGRSATAVLRVAVPVNATAGEYYGVVFAELQGSGLIAVNSRVGIRVYLSVGPGGEPRSDYTVDSLQAVRQRDGRPAVLAAIHNTGARALDLRGSLRLSNGPGGLSAGPFPVDVGTTLAPGQTAPVTVPLDRAIRGGPWHAVLDARSGKLLRRAEADITFPDAAGTEAPAVRAKEVPLYKDRGIVSTVAAFLVGLLLLALLVLWLVARRRRREDDR